MPFFLMVLHFFQEATKSAAPAGSGAAAPNTPPPNPFGGGMLVPLLGLVVIFWLFMFRPQAKERKAREAMLKALKKGDRIVLSCGLIGQVAALTEQDVLVKVDDKDPRRMRFRRYAIQGVIEQEEAPAAEAVEAEAK